MSVRPWLKELNPVVWERHGVGGEVDEEELGREELPEGVEPEKLRKSRNTMRWVMQDTGIGVEFVLEPGPKNGTAVEMVERRRNFQSMFGLTASQGMSLGTSGQY
eukprot:5828040-Karenia_brevis.AAC.1